MKKIQNYLHFHQLYLKKIQENLLLHMHEFFVHFLMQFVNHALNKKLINLKCLNILYFNIVYLKLSLTLQKNIKIKNSNIKKLTE